MSSELTPRQAQILDMIRRSIADQGYPPTRGEICAAFKFRSANAAEAHLRALAHKGAIEMIEGISRGIRLKDGAEGGHGDGLPLVGRVAAGSPLLAEQNIERHARVDPALFRPRADYLLKVKGASMRDAGILDGDWVAVHRTREARSGQIVVARLRDEVTLKVLRRQGRGIELLPRNPDFKPLRVDPARDGFEIEGLCVGVLRPVV